MHRIEHSPQAEGRVCAFTGHRPSKYPYLAQENSEAYRRMEAEVLSQILKLAKDGYSHFICGGALGADMLCAQQVLTLRAIQPHVTLELALPCPEHSADWQERDKQALEQISEEADIITTVCPMYTQFCMNERNRYMVERCDTLVAIYDGTRGGTQNTLNMALDAGKHGIIISPKDFTLTEF